MRTQKKMLMAPVLAASLVGMSTGPVMADEETLKSKKMGVVKSDNVKLACNFKVS